MSEKKFPERMTTKNENGEKTLWVKDAGRKGAYQPMEVFFSNDEPVTHTMVDARKIRNDYRLSFLSMVVIGDESGVTAVSPDWDFANDTDNESVADDMRSSRGVM